MTKPQIALFTLGGTIAMTISDDGGVIPALSGDDLINAVPDLAGMAQIKVQALSQTASANIGFGQVLKLAKAVRLAVEDGADGVVITQGTDSMAETAFMLSVLLREKVPIIVTGAMRHPGQKSADGPANLLAAIRAALSSKLASCGVLLCMNDTLHAARYVEKCHTSGLDAFRSAGAGPVASHTEGRIIRYMVPDLPPHLPVTEDNFPYIALVMAAFGDDGRLLDHLPVKTAAVVIAGFGGGHLPESMADRAALLAQDIPVVLSSQTGGGNILEKTYGYKGGEMDLIARGLIPSGPYSPQKARILLACLLAQGRKDLQALREDFSIFNE